MGPRAIQRASTGDLMMLAMGSRRVPEQLAAVLVLEPRSGFGWFDIDAAAGLLARMAAAVPRLRQRLVSTPPGCGRPVWVDDPGFVADRHVHTTRCPASCDQQALLDLACSLATSPLPWSRPLWSATLVTGLADDAVGLIVVLHHVVADGVGGLALLGALTDGARTGSTPDTTHSTEDIAGVSNAATPTAPPPRPPPGVRALAADSLAAKAKALAGLPHAARTVRASMASVGGPRPARVADNSLLRPTGTRRRAAVATADLRRVQACARGHGATVNDVVLVAVASALGELLKRRGERADAVTVAVPVAARRPEAGSGLGNRIRMMLVPVPCQGPPRQRLRAVAARTRARKRHHPAATT